MAGLHKHRPQTTQVKSYTELLRLPSFRRTAFRARVCLFIYSRMSTGCNTTPKPASHYLPVPLLIGEYPLIQSTCVCFSKLAVIATYTAVKVPYQSIIHSSSPFLQSRPDIPVADHISRRAKVSFRTDGHGCEPRKEGRRRRFSTLSWHRE